MYVCVFNCMHACVCVHGMFVMNDSVTTRYMLGKNVCDPTIASKSLRPSSKYLMLTQPHI